jgi:hypothetical protein
MEHAHEVTVGELSDDLKPANPNPKIADEKGCSPPYTVDVHNGKKTWKGECL